MDRLWKFEDGTIIDFARGLAGDRAYLVIEGSDGITSIHTTVARIRELRDFLSQWVETQEKK